MKIGFIGLGSQGGPMAGRLIEAGHSVVLWARRAESLEPYAETSAETAATIGELGAQCDHVGICVVNDDDVLQVCDELMPAMRIGGRIAIHSTILPNTCITLAEQAASMGLSLIDAPVSGGAPRAEEGTLTVMVGGEEDAVELAHPIFEAFAGLIVNLGGVGAGQMAKLVNNTLMAAHFAMAHHAVSVGTGLGLDREALIELIKASSGRSYSFEVYARMSDLSAFAHGAKLLAKDVRLLGDISGSDPSFATLCDVADPFLDSVLKA